MSNVVRSRDTLTIFFKSPLALCLPDWALALVCSSPCSYVSPPLPPRRKAVIPTRRRRRTRTRTRRVSERGSAAATATATNYTVAVVRLTIQVYAPRRRPLPSRIILFPPPLSSVFAHSAPCPSSGLTPWTDGLSHSRRPSVSRERSAHRRRSTIVIDGFTS